LINSYSLRPSVAGVVRMSISATASLGTMFAAFAPTPAAAMPRTFNDGYWQRLLVVLAYFLGLRDADSLAQRRFIVADGRETRSFGGRE
jgi:hypothetical protein